MPEVNWALSWDGTGEKIYELGIDHCVLYPLNSTSHTYTPGVAWNGITSVQETPSGADENALYADNIKYASLRGTEEFGGTIEAYTFPDEWYECDGSKEAADGVVIGQQNRKTFGLSYRTTVGNDEENLNYGYKLHLVYGCTASPSERSYETINDSPDAGSFSWEFTTIPVNVTGVANAKATSIITIDSTKADATKLAALEQILYGTPAAGQTAAVDPRLPFPDEVIDLMD